MNALPEERIIVEVAKLKRMEPPIIEKDWHVTQVIATLSQVQHPESVREKVATPAPSGKFTSMVQERRDKKKPRQKPTRKPTDTHDSN